MAILCNHYYFKQLYQYLNITVNRGALDISLRIFMIPAAFIALGTAGTALVLSYILYNDG
jgi:uncharacterized membrane-anchored protein YitT (DUF2179 family)